MSLSLCQAIKPGRLCFHLLPHLDKYEILYFSSRRWRYETRRWGLDKTPINAWIICFVCSHLVNVVIKGKEEVEEEFVSHPNQLFLSQKVTKSKQSLAVKWYYYSVSIIRERQFKSCSSYVNSQLLRGNRSPAFKGYINSSLTTF